jgi:hypothetical protein
MQDMQEGECRGAVLKHHHDLPATAVSVKEVETLQVGVKPREGGLAGQGVSLRNELIVGIIYRDDWEVFLQE